MPLDGIADPPSYESDHPSLPDQPAKGTIRTRVWVEFLGPVKEPTQVRVAVAVPDGAKSVGCQSVPDTLKCGDIGPYPNVAIDWTPNRFRTVEGVLPVGAKGFGITVDFTGIKGLAFGVAGGRAKVRQPQLLTTDGYWWPESREHQLRFPLRVRTVVTFHRAERLNWNQRPDAGQEKLDGSPPQRSDDSIAPSEDVVSWFYDLPAEDISLPAPVYGIDQSVVDSDTGKSFWQGIVFGVAGSAFIVAMQVSIQALALTRLRSKRRARQGRASNG
ncbi:MULTISPECIES: hypothetical protein [unclassified Mycobacterium]|uniref:hypothetical protein n=1 Tax=unclassified Mycobacterium TaxID=2642494 RepID=UPI0012E90A22|nr:MULTISPECIES: hypothetical protein [unclassified Mycobacterium]